MATTDFEVYTLQCSPNIGSQNLMHTGAGNTVVNKSCATQEGDLTHLPSQVFTLEGLKPRIGARNVCRVSAGLMQRLDCLQQWLRCTLRCGVHASVPLNFTMLVLGIVVLPS